MEFHPRQREHAGRANRIQKQNASKCCGLVHVPSSWLPPCPPTLLVWLAQNATQVSGSTSTGTCYFNKKPFLQKVEHVCKAHVLEICSLFLNISSDFHLKLPWQRAAKSVCCLKCFSEVMTMSYLW